jgi:hypothetical protein
MDLRSRIWPNRLMETPAAVCTVINMVSVQCFILYCDCYQWNKAWFHENFRLIKEVSILNFLIVVGSAVFAIVYCEISGTAGALILSGVGCSTRTSIFITMHDLAMIGQAPQACSGLLCANTNANACGSNVIQGQIKVIFCS